MSGYSLSYFKDARLTVGALKVAIADLDDSLVLQVPAMHGDGFVDADHVFVDVTEGYVSIDGDICGHPARTEEPATALVAETVEDQQWL